MSINQFRRINGSTSIVLLYRSTFPCHFNLSIHLWRHFKIEPTRRRIAATLDGGCFDHAKENHVDCGCFIPSFTHRSKLVLLHSIEYVKHLQMVLLFCQPWNENKKKCCDVTGLCVGILYRSNKQHFVVVESIGK